MARSGSGRAEGRRVGASREAAVWSKEPAIFGFERIFLLKLCSDEMSHESDRSTVVQNKGRYHPVDKPITGCFFMPDNEIRDKKVLP